MPARRLLLALLLAAVVTRSARADGVPVGPVPTDDQSRPAVTADGHGGAVVTYKTASFKVGAVHLNGTGVPDGGLGFAPSTCPFALDTVDPPRVVLPADTQLVIASDRATASGAAMTSMRSGGSVVPGFPVSLAMPYRAPALVPGLGGRTLIVSKNDDASTFWTLRAAIVGANGQVQSSIQLPSSVQFFNADPLDATTDGAGGLIAVFPYYDASGSGSKDLAVFKYTASGTRPWGDVPRPMVFAAGDQTDPHIVPDGTGGALFAWTDPRNSLTGSDIYALHMDRNAQRVGGWDFYGQPVCEAAGEQSQPRLATDGLGGIWVVWKDQRSELAGDLRCSHVFADGTFAPGFTSSGLELATAPGVQGEAQVVGDGAGGMFAVWRDERSGNADIYAQHVLANGALSAGWPANGRALTTATGTQEQPAIALVGVGRVLIAWRDARTSPSRIYATAVVDAGTTDVPAAGHGALRISAAGSMAGELRLRLSLPAAGPARVELLDLNGRRRASRECEGPLDAAILTLSAPARLEPGRYFARVSQGGESASTSVTVLR
jgi:hypothetical protein